MKNSTSGVSLNEVMESITGFDELAMEKHMGMDIYTGGEAKPMVLTRSIVFIHLVHQGNPATDARQKVMEMTVKEVNDYFEDEPEEVMPDEPDSEVGKGDWLPETEQPDSRTFASVPE